MLPHLKTILGTKLLCLSQLINLVVIIAIEQCILMICIRDLAKAEKRGGLLHFLHPSFPLPFLAISLSCEKIKNVLKKCFSDGKEVQPTF